WPRDWSSDVCSSDLKRKTSIAPSRDRNGAASRGAIEVLRFLAYGAQPLQIAANRSGVSTSDWSGERGLRTQAQSIFKRCACDGRSEERRVGKECGSR